MINTTIEEVTDETIETSNMWLAAALFSKGCAVESMYMMGVAPYYKVFVFKHSKRAAKLYGKYKEKMLNVNVYEYYLAMKDLKRLQ